MDTSPACTSLLLVNSAAIETAARTGWYEVTSAVSRCPQETHRSSIIAVGKAPSGSVGGHVPRMRSSRQSVPAKQNKERPT